MSFMARWACLMYHATPDSGSAPDYFAVPAPKLAEQIRAMKSLQLQGRSLEACLAAPMGNQVAVTFDDALVSNHRVALPLLAEVGMSATVFVVPTWVGRAGYCSWAELRELRDHGWSIQSHTHTHPFLSTLNERALEQELRLSREIIEQQIGAPVTTLALPNGDWPARRLRWQIAAAGHSVVSTSRWHANGDAERRAGVIGRYTVRRATTIPEFTDRLVSLPGVWSAEGLRLEALGVARSALGVDRYRRWRRRVLGESGSAASTASDSSLNRV